MKIGKKKVAAGLREAEFFISYFHHIPCYVELGSDSDFTIAKRRPIQHDTGVPGDRYDGIPERSGVIPS